MISPVFFQLFHLPFLCDLIGFAALILIVRWLSKLGTATLVGFIATITDFMFRPDASTSSASQPRRSIDAWCRCISRWTRTSFPEEAFGFNRLIRLVYILCSCCGLNHRSFLHGKDSSREVGRRNGWGRFARYGSVIGGALGISLTNALTARGITA
jgi:hypothetical protein